MNKAMHIPSQNDRILDFLGKHKQITQKEAMEQLGIYRLASRISDLKKRGYEFHTETVTRNNRYGEKTSFTAYELEKES